MPHEEKSTEAEKERRVDIIVELLLAGLKRQKILQYITNKDAERKAGKIDDSRWIRWNVKPRQIDNYIAEATDFIRAMSNTNREYEIGKSLARLDSLYNKNLLIQDFKAALAVVRENDILQGLNRPNELHQTGAIELHVVHDDDNTGKARQQPEPETAPKKDKPGGSKRGVKARESMKGKATRVTDRPPAKGARTRRGASKPTKAGAVTREKPGIGEPRIVTRPAPPTRSSDTDGRIAKGGDNPLPAGNATNSDESGDNPGTKFIITRE